MRLFAEHGHEVLAIDFSDAAIEAARRELGPLSRLVKKADFFGLQEGQFDLVYERAFLCALPRALWPAWGTRVAELVRPGGELAGFYYLDDNPRGPPFGISREGLHELLGKRLRCNKRRARSACRIDPGFQGKGDLAGLEAAAMIPRAC